MTALASISLEQAAARLAEIVGPGHARLSGQTISAAPADTEQISEVLRFANAGNLVVTPTGSGTKLAWGNPVASTILLSLDRMNALREHAWEDMTCIVQAGCPWSAMQSELTKRNQMVALDPLWPDRATVGGIVSTNDSGALRLRYGSLRDLVLGVTVVLADGTIARSGGKVVKNVAGYDLHKLLIGSYGTLGVIAEVNFRLHPIEEHAQTWTIAGDTGLLGELMMRVMDSTMQVSAMQLRGLHHYGSDCLDVRFAGHPDCLASQHEQLLTMSGGVEISPADETVWQTRERIFDDAIARDGLVLKLAMLPSQIPAVHRKVAAWGSETACVTQANGLMTAAVLDRYTYCEFPVNDLREMLRDTGGSVVVLLMPETLRNEFDAWSSDSTALPLMREIKHRFDPHRILNPGRFVGGI
jgi:glycolate dehydrogenase FAD-binding subunit